MVLEVPAVKHQADEVRNQVFLVGGCELGQEVHVELFLFSSLAEFGKHFVD